MTSDRPNVLLLIADTLRADEAYSDTTDTPTLDALAREGTRFDEAHAESPGTPVSHAAMFSGQYPSKTGVAGQTDIPSDVPMLAEHLWEAGYDTLGIAGPGRMGSDWGYDRGFEEYVETYAGDRPSYEGLAFPKQVLSGPTSRWPLLRDFVRMLRDGPDKDTYYKFSYLASAIERDLDRPFFGMLNTTIVHSPYDPPRPYKEAATPELDRPRWHVLEHLLDREETLDRDDVRPERIYHAQTTDGIAWYLADPDYLTDAELSVLRTWYRASIEYFDEQLGRFLDRLDRLGELEDTVLLVTADHGEYFGEHGLLVHSHHLYDEVTNVPLVVARPGVPDDERSDLVSHVDLFDTICDLAGVEPPEVTSGTSVFADDRPDAVSSEYGVRHENATGHRKCMDDEQLTEFGLGQKAERTSEHTYFYRSDETERLYPRSTDGEGERIESPDPDVLAELRERMDDAIGLAFQSTDPPGDVDEDIEDHLRQLGYVE